jgi:hypothetical protein
MINPSFPIEPSSPSEKKDRTNDEVAGVPATIPLLGAAWHICDFLSEEAFEAPDQFFLCNFIVCDEPFTWIDDTRLLYCFINAALSTLS